MTSMRVAKRPRLMTLTEWSVLDEDVEGELVDGVLEEEEMPTWLHEIVAAWLVMALGGWARKRRAFVASSELKIAVGPRRGRKPDVSVFVDDMPALGDALVRAKPYLVIEVLSPRLRDQRRDRVEKLKDYRACGARHYWIVDPQLRTIELYAFASRTSRPSAETVSEGRARPRGFPGLSLDLDDLWRTIDEAAAPRRRSRR